MIDMKSWLTGFALGLCGKPLPFAKKTPIGYSYNGVVLPKLPEWDREMYPYAVIVVSILGDNKFLLCSPTPFVADGSSYVSITNSQADTLKYGLSNGEWTSPELNNKVSYATPIWTNTDVYYSDGTLYLAASEPVPVYE